MAGRLVTGALLLSFRKKGRKFSCKTLVAREETFFFLLAWAIKRSLQFTQLMQFDKFFGTQITLSLANFRDYYWLSYAMSFLNKPASF